MQKTLALSIKMNETGALDSGYVIADWVAYPAYMKNDVWADFYETMKSKYSTAFAEYGDGSGGELLPKNKYPPKMASYGSSSRMVFNLFKQNPACFACTWIIRGYIIRSQGWKRYIKNSWTYYRKHYIDTFASME